MIFETFKELLESSQNEPLYKIVQNKEAQFLDIKVENYRNNVKKILETMKNAIKNGLKNSQISQSGLSGGDCSKLQKYFEFNSECILLSKLQQKILLYALATSEQNAQMGRIAACPTAGSSGIVPSVLIALGEELNADAEKLTDSLIVAGIVGEILSEKTPVAGAVAGCQAECGVACAMAAAAAAYLLGANNCQIINAAALALKNILGLTCDPVAGLVEVPCVKRNAFMAIQSITGCQMSLAGIESKIPLDEISLALCETGNLMSPKLKESSQGGLAITPTAVKITKELNKKWYLTD